MWKIAQKKVLLGTLLIFGALLVNSCILLPVRVPEELTPIAISTNSPTPADVIIPPTATSEVVETVETPVTETATSEPVDTQTPLPVNTDTPEPTEEPTNTPEPTQIPFIYQIQEGAPAYITNFAHPDAGCDWLGIAGQIFGETDQPVINVVALVSGEYDGSRMEAVGISGTGAGDNYGPGGFEIIISDKLLSTDDQLSIQLFDLDGLPVSDVFALDTFNDCGQNLIIINFVSRR